MEAKEKALSFIKGQTIYRIPFFQRGYVWDEENWSDLWDELSSTKRDCFFGSLILKEEKDERREDITYKTVIDGQQRLTTFSILLRAISDSFCTDDELDDEIEPFLYFVRTIRSDTGKEKKKSLKITNSKIDSETYKLIIEGEYRNKLDKIVLIDENGEPSNKLLRCYKYFRKKLDDNVESRAVVLNKLTLDTSKILVVIDLNSSENEQAIFDTINSAGVKLTNADIIKNALFQNIIYNSEGNVDSEIDDFFNSTWIKYFEKDEETLNLWLTKKVVGRIERTNLDMFLHCFAIIKQWYDPQKDKMEDLANRYKSHLSEMTREDIKAFITELCRYSSIYKENFVGFDSCKACSYNQPKARLLQILNAIKVTTFDAYILNALATYSQERQVAEFKKLECYVMRNHVMSNSTKIKNYNKDSIQLLHGKFDFDGLLSEEDQNDALIVQAMKNIRKNGRAALVLFWIELYRHTSNSSDLSGVPLNYSFQLEHVMPQAWKEFWDVLLPMRDGNGNEILDLEEARRIRSQAVYEIGNMTLLTSSLNARLRNYPFIDKVNGKIIGGEFKDGIKRYGALSITTEITNRNPLDWNEQAIAERTAELTKEFLVIWPGKYVSNQQASSNATSTNNLSNFATDHWLIPCSPHYYDIAKAAKELSAIDWRQPDTNIHEGCFAYIYVTAPLMQIKYKAIIVKANKAENTIDDSKYFLADSSTDNNQKYVVLKIIKTYDEGIFQQDFLKANGISSTQGWQRIPQTLFTLLEKED